ncbi:MAG: hypothetical protein ACXWV8_14405, partial [Chitinophagaceae bacterium]
TPSLLVPLRIQLFQTSKRIYTIPAGSVWIRSNRIAQTAAGNLYTGLTIKGGQLEFSIDTPLGADKIAVVGNTTISLRLDLAQPVINDVSPDEHGVDVRNANLQLPEKFSLQFSSATASIITVSDGSWNLYGTPCRFTFDAAKASFWEPALNRVLVPFNCDQADFEILSCQSPFIQLEGSASIIQSAWALTAATININNPPAAAGIGAIAVQCSKGISNSWTGLKDNNLYERAFVHFTSAWFMLEPGRIAITDLATANLHAKQLYKLWTDELENDEDKERRSTIELTFNKAFPLIYNAYQKGDEAIITQANSSANIDRPVKTNGDPFELRSKNSWYMLSVNQLLQLVSIYDDNILIDTKKPGEDIPTFTASAIALHNALFLVSPVAGFGLFGELLDENTFERGILATSHGLLSYLPTLPDPYAANIGFLRRQRGTDDVDEQRFNTNSYNGLLVAMIGWPAPGALKPNPVLSFHFAPIPQPNVQAVVNADSFRIHGAFTDPASPELQGINIDSIKNKRVAKRLVGHVNTFADFNLAQNDRSEFIPEVSDFFSLVDVSTNADWMGISFGLTDDNFIFRRTHIPNPAVPEGNPLKINGLDVVAPGKFVRAYTTPLISWEPVFNISPPPPPPIAPPVLPLPLPLPDKNPPVGFLFFENDGGPTRIFNTSIDLVSLAPIPLTKYIVDNAKNQPQLPAWSIFTLPYGIRSLGIFYKDSFFYNSPEGPNNGRGAKIAMNSPEFINEVGKTLTGGIQLKITGAEHPSEGKVFEGASYQYSNIVSITGTPTNKSILGTHVTHIFNSEFGRSISVRGVPLERMDLSGYGANIFSNWLNPNAAFGKTSQARFDVFKGRTAHEVIQVKSIIYPWAIRVVRTITIYRTGSAYTFRHDSGWIAESDGVYDFSNWVYPEGDFTNTKRIPSPYIFHPGIIKGVYNVKNIVENELLPFTGNMQIAAGQNYVHEITGEERPATAAFSMNVLLAPVYFDANILIDFVTEGKVNDKVPSKKMLGYVQLNPLGQPISPTLFKNLLLVQQGSLGGPVDCLVNIANSKQKMRINRADVNA